VDLTEEEEKCYNKENVLNMYIPQFIPECLQESSNLHTIKELNSGQCGYVKAVN
jgi:hypothetical protein